jgi:hypothetical protein
MQLTPEDSAELRGLTDALASGRGPGPARLLLGIVWRHLGWRSVHILPRAGLAVLLGRRRLAGPAWIAEAARRFVPLAAIHRRTRAALGQERADALARELILKLGLAEWVRLLPREEARRAGAAEFLAIWRSRIKANMGAHSEEQFELRGRDEMVMTVRRCMLLQVFEVLGVEHLAPWLCQTDLVYLAGLAPEIAFSRERTITAGDSCCTFRFRFVRFQCCSARMTAAPNAGRRTATGSELSGCSPAPGRPPALKLR